MASRSNVDNYDVFINFRGVDTRHGFVKILYNELVAEGMRVFLDDKELIYGRRLNEELPQAINNSKIYITVISQTYASSKWCLRELAEIVRNKNEFKEKKEILPVFYKIRTDDVKLKTDLFKDQLNSLVNKNVRIETVKEWGVALKGITDLKAWKVTIDGGSKEDAECCREIVKRASISLRVKHKPLSKVLFGMEDPVEEVVQLLNIGNTDFQVIGIHGMGGSGKTTLASAVYNKLCDSFDCCCFLPDVREALDNDKGSRSCLELQKKLLKEVSNHEDGDEITDIDIAVRKIQLTLKGKNVLIVFDDISKPDQVVRLIGDNYTMFGNKSRIIITTRDERVVRNRDSAQLTKIYEMKAMENEHALELFSWHAFGELTPPEGYSLLSNDAVCLTGRLPLSLVITGSLFFIGGRKNWEQTVEKLKKMLNEDVQERLKISYTGLEEWTREIFLDIACFFVDEKRSYEFNMWDACGFFPELAIQELLSTCLIKIDDVGTYRMHDHIKDLGRNIVRKEGPKDKEQRSRIWNTQDAIDILTRSKNKENNKIEGILLEGLNGDEILTLRGENFVNLDKLRFLCLDGSNSNHVKPTVEVEALEILLPNLRWLSLKYMKIRRLNRNNFYFWLYNTTNFNLKELVVLDFSHSDVSENCITSWEVFKVLPKLEVLGLSFCVGLKKTPNLSFYCTSLRKLILFCCDNIEEIDGSITSLLKLRHLDLSFCKSLKELPNSIGKLVELEVLLLVGCIALVSLPNSLTSLSKLHILKLSSCKSLKSLPDSAGQMVQLIEVDISYLLQFKNNKKLPGFISKQKKLKVLRADSMGMEGVPSEIEELTCLREISFSNSNICGFPSLVKLTCLETLNLLDCNHFQQLPEPLPTSLVRLRVSSRSLRSIPDYSYLINLTYLEWQRTGFRIDVETREVQEWNIDWIWRLSKLKNLELSVSNRYVTTTIESPASLSQLQTLSLSWLDVETCVVIPSFLYALTRLDISDFRKTTSLSLPRLIRLTHFFLSNNSKLAQILGLGELQSLIYLEIIGCSSLERLDDISKLRQLVTLRISFCKGLRVISIVPCVRSLKTLCIADCESLVSLVGPSDSESQTNSSLDDLHLVEHLTIRNCPLLENKLPVELRKKITRSVAVIKEDEWMRRRLTNSDNNEIQGKKTTF